ncbi:MULTISPECIES: hypothetical protein [unclassified Chelatococcus]|uniref:hypothetical protein n=1 Tax=unclassified Chelatococcus TaxID=2638111 RepID=UPI001BCF1060|nr:MULTISPECIES: hypothetical protein [unclassified Chelatococcus]MBS7696294.1 hypothetical protein [Chelatococcus sp. YT9]MBX3556903.1 hypothetical protein [Chelatococcus sp.]
MVFIITRHKDGRREYLNSKSKLRANLGGASVATKTYNIGTNGYSIIAGNLSQQNNLVIKGNGSNAKVVIESTNIFGFNIPTTLNGSVNGQSKFIATLINDGVSFAGTSGNESFDAAKYLGDVRFNGGAGTNKLIGASGNNVFTHDYNNSGVDSIVGGVNKTVNWSLLWWNYSKTHVASNELVINGTSAADVFNFSGSNTAFKVFKDNTNNHVIDASQFNNGHVKVNGGAGGDQVDLRMFTGVLTFNGDTGNDTLVYRDGYSGIGSTYNGGADRDGLAVDAKTSGSTLILSDSALTNGSSTLLHLSSVEDFNFVGAAGDDDVDASQFSGRVIFRGRGGENELHAGKGDNDAIHELSYGGHDTLFGNTVSGQTSLEIVGDGQANILAFAGDANTFKVTHNSSEVIDATDINGIKTVNANAGADALDIADYKGKVAFNGGAGDDLLTVRDKTSGAGTTYDGGADTDTLKLVAAIGGSTITVNTTKLVDSNGADLVTFQNIERFVFDGKLGDDTADASTFTGFSELSGGWGNDTLRAGSGGSALTGGFGGDDIHLGSGVDEVYYTGDIFQSIFLAMDNVTGFDTTTDKLLFNTGNAIQADGAVKILGATIGAFDDGILQFGTNSIGNAARTTFNNLSLFAAAEFVAGYAADDSVVGFQHKGEWYVAEFGDGLIIDNIIHLAGVNLTGTNLAGYVSFA